MKAWGHLKKEGTAGNIIKEMTALWNKMMTGKIQVEQIFEDSDLEIAFEIRRIVFILEQKVPEKEEFDEFDMECEHFLGYYGIDPAGTARMRITEQGVKLERFAVLPEFRRKKVGSEILKRLIEEARLHKPEKIYLHAQTEVKRFYEKHGFVSEGEEFIEADIPHIKMILKK